MSQVMSRRRFLQLVSAAAFAAALGPFRRFGILRRRALSPERSVAARLAGLPSDPRSARVLGRAYLATAPAERDLRRLEALLTAGALPAGFVLAADDGALRRRARAALCEDFARGRTVSVRGWTLSLTEARLCALAVLA